MGSLNDLMNYLVEEVALAGPQGKYFLFPFKHPAGLGLLRMLRARFFSCRSK